MEKQITRSKLELLVLLKNEIRDNYLHTGICGCLINLFGKEELKYPEFIYLMALIKFERPNIFKNIKHYHPLYTIDAFFWHRNNKEIRVKFLNYLLHKETKRNVIRL